MDFVRLILRRSDTSSLEVNDDEEVDACKEKCANPALIKANS